MNGGQQLDQGVSSARQAVQVERPLNARTWRGTLRNRFRGSAIDILFLFVLVQVGCAIAGLIVGDKFPYLSAANISVQLKAIPELGVLALGVGVLMIAGEFDLSVGANYTFAAIVMATVYQQSGVPAFLAALLAIAIGAGIGLVNAIITLRANIPSFITTLGMALFWSGTTLFYHGAQTLRFYPEKSFSNLMAGSVGVIPASFLWFLGLAVILWIAVHHHKFGNHAFAVGGNRTAATAIGINPVFVKSVAFAVVGICAALSGILATTRVNAIEPGQGANLPLQAIAACVIGGVDLMGGRGTILGIVLGAALMYTIQDILLLMGAPGFYLDVFVGALIVAAATFNQMIRRRVG